MRINAFSGRVIFDRMPKTGGHAVARWLRNELGSGSVTDNLIGHHQDLIRRHGGAYSVISAHVLFDGHGLDPRYRYVTCLRDPVDRAISWLYFMLGNHSADDLDPGLWDAVKRFVDSDGKVVGPEVAGCISNYYVRHFASIDAIPGEQGPQDLLEAATTALAHYDVCGFYEDMPGLINDLGKFLQIPAPDHLDSDNVTLRRPTLQEIPTDLRWRLIELNALDLELYRRQRRRYDRGLNRPVGKTPAVPVWTAMAEPMSRRVETEALTLHSAATDRNEPAVDHGTRLTFALDFSLNRPVEELLVGIHIIDQDHRWAFGTNSRILGQSLRDMEAGRYRAEFEVAADLPEGVYSAGFAFVEQEGGRMQDLAWYDRRVNFMVRVQRLPGAGGYSDLTTGFRCMSAEAADRGKTAFFADAIKLRALPKRRARLLSAS